MQGQDTEPLPTGLWLREMAALANDCAGRADLAEGHAIRRAYHLCCLCPRPLRPLLLPGYLDSDLEGFLARGEVVQAVALILGNGEIAIRPLDDRSGFEAQYGMGDGVHAALTARLAGLAMIGAWARFFSEQRSS